jgi:endonuclease/exonuclease/phosphatase family metal-dependent hydrolase
VSDDPVDRSARSRRARWVAPSAVLGLAAVVVLVGAIWTSRAPGSSSPMPRSSVVTAPTSWTATRDATVARRPSPGQQLEPARSAADPRCADSGPRILRILQFNIHFGVSRAGGVDLSEIAEEIEAAHPDLVSLNEVDSGTFRSRRIDEAGYLAEATGLHAVYGPNIPWEGGLFGNAILTRYPVVDSQNLRLPGIRGLEPRGLLTATVRVGGRSVSFSSVHLSDGDDGRLSRSLQAQAVGQVVRHASAPEIVAGDLNSGPHTLPVRVLRQHLLDAQELGGTGPGDTIPEQAPQSRFDYVLYDGHLAVVPGSTRVLPSASSDHRAVFTELRLLPGRCAG